VRRAELDERGMVCDLDRLDGALADVLGRLDGQDLDAIVEGGEWLGVHVWESAEAYGAYRGPA
jgi:hypothetical protein